jgi:hypothetical protein
MARLRNVFASAYWSLRRVLGLGYSVIQRDLLTDLRRQTEELGAAGVESSSYVGSELRTVDRRLARVEAQLEDVRRLLEQRHSGG